MKRRLGLPLLALLGALTFVGAPAAQAAVRFGVTVGPPYPPGYVYPQPYVAPYDYGYYSTYPPAYYDYGWYGHRDHRYWDHHARHEYREHERHERYRGHDRR